MHVLHSHSFICQHCLRDIFILDQTLLMNSVWNASRKKLSVSSREGKCRGFFCMCLRICFLKHCICILFTVTFCFSQGCVKGIILLGMHCAINWKRVFFCYSILPILKWARILSKESHDHLFMWRKILSVQKSVLHRKFKSIFSRKIGSYSSYAFPALLFLVDNI